MDGLLIIDKPGGITSHDVVSRVRRILKTRRVGHTGTLDPFATGVMVILVGKATRLAQFLDKDEKEYEALVRFGFETDTGDRTGRQKEKGKRQNPVTLEDVRAVLPKFLGEIEQLPPMFSAKKIDGKKLYEHARKGETVERDAVKIVIYEIQAEPPASIVDETQPVETVNLHVRCSAGTYIRTLAEDIAKRIGSAAHLTELRRRQSGRFGIDQSISLDDLEKLDQPADRLLPLSDAVSHLQAVTLSGDRADATRNGLSSRVGPAQFSDGEAIRMLDEAGNLLAVGVFESAEQSIRPKVVLV